MSVDIDLDWYKPRVHEVSDGVYRLPLPLPSDALRAVNVYLLVGETDVVLVDGGWAIEESLARLKSYLGELGLALADISRSLVTHCHRDHYTQAVVLRRLVGTKISLGAAEAPSIEVARGPASGRREAQLNLLRRAGAESLADELGSFEHRIQLNRTEWETPDEWLDGTRPLEVAGRRLLAIPTPGHTRGHYVFADEDKGLMFSGDHVLPHITPSIGFEAAPPPLPLSDYLASLARVRAMPDMRLLPAHGWIAGSVHARVDELLTHHEERLQQCREAVAGGAKTAVAVAGELRWTRRGRSLSTLDLDNQMLAVIESLAHLDVLVARGDLSSTDVDGVHTYTPPSTPGA